MSDEHTTTRTSARIRAAGLFCYNWLLVGFVLGTIVLLWPVKWLTDALHRAHVGQSAENGLVISLVLVYVGVSLVLARLLNKFVCGCSTKRLRYGVLSSATLCALSTAYAWRDPGRLLSAVAGGGDMGTLRMADGATFEFGAYPDSARLAQLKRAGVTAVISLQDAAIPVEHEGVEEEEALARKLGLTFMNAPMIPWFSENKESLDKIREIVRMGRGHYYVHCGLGRDRVNMVKRVIEGMGAKAIATSDLHDALGFDGRAADFQQGSLILEKPGVWMVPYPEKEELYGCFLEGRPGQVVLLLDSTATPQDSLLHQARQLFTSYQVRFVELPMYDASPARVRVVADSINHLAPPVTIVAFRTPWHNGRQKGDEAAFALSNALAPGVWHITSGTVKPTHKANEWTGGKETGC